MSNFRIAHFLILCLMSVGATTAFAQKDSTSGKLGIGLQATSPVVGLGVKYEVIPNVNIKAALGPVNDTYTVAGVRMEITQKRDKYNALCYFSYGSGSHDVSETNRESSWHAVGLGIGLELFAGKSHEFGFEGNVGFIKYWHIDPNTRNYLAINGGAGIFYYLR